MRRLLTYRLAVGLVLLVVSGCAQRADWIDRTIVTVDVEGRWTGTWAGPGGGPLALTLRQTGPKVTGDVALIGLSSHRWSGPVEGTITGDMLKFSRPDGLLRGQAIVAGEEMAGTITFFPGTRTLRLQRQP